MCIEQEKHATSQFHASSDSTRKTSEHEIINNDLLTRFRAISSEAEYSSDVLTRIYLEGMTYKDFPERGYNAYYLLADKAGEKVRIITLETLYKATGGDLKLLAQSATDMVLRHKKVLGFFNLVLTPKNTVQTTCMVLRALEAKDFLTLSQPSSALRNLGYGTQNFYFKDFTYGTPVVLVEGLKDCLAMQTLYPFCIALETNHVQSGLLNVLTQLTNHVILAYDADDAGRKGMKGDTYKFRERGIRVSVLEHYPCFKDVGEILDLSPFEVTSVLEWYRANIKRLLEQSL